MSDTAPLRDPCEPSCRRQARRRAARAQERDERVSSRLAATAAPRDPAASASLWPAASLRPHPVSVTIYGDEQADPELAESIRTHGILEPLVVRGDGTIISGHRRWKAALACSLEEVPIVEVEFACELDERQAIVEYNRQREKTLSQRMREADELQVIEAERARERQAATRFGADGGANFGTTAAGRTRNKVAAAIDMKHSSFEKARSVYEAAKAGNEVAVHVMAALDAGETTIHRAFLDVRQEELRREFAQAVPGCEIPDLPAQPISRLGDLWLPGAHRLVNADSTKTAVVQRLMAGELARLMCTDPPYLVDYDGSGHSQSWANRPATRDKTSGFLR